MMTACNLCQCQGPLKFVTLGLAMIKHHPDPRGTAFYNSLRPRYLGSCITEIVPEKNEAALSATRPLFGFHAGA